MRNSVTFHLRKEQVDFLKSKYSNIQLVQNILAKEDNLEFTVSVDDKIEFYLWLIDESINTMDEDYDATEDTYELEGTADLIYYETEPK